MTLALLFLASLLATTPKETPTPTSASASPEYEICPGLRLQDRTSLELNESERVLLCGSEDLQAWKTIPRNQRKFFIRRFLQQRGYLSPDFREKNGGVLLVIPGPRTKIKHIAAEGLPPRLIELDRKRYIRGETLTPGKLNELSGWVKAEMQNAGYGCPRVDLTADPEGGVALKVLPGPIHLVTEIERPTADHYHVQIFERYEAFHIGEPLDNRLLTLSASRILAQGSFLSSYYELDCTDSQSLKIVQRVVAAEPRLITIGIGVDTEGLLKARAQWKHSRIDSNASSLQISLDGSFVQQGGEVLMQWYPAAPNSRFYLMPKLKATRYSEDQYEAITGEIGLVPAFSFDHSPFSVQMFWGPAFEYVDTRKGEGPKNSRFASFKGQLKIMSHSFEYFMGNPRSGWQAIFNSYSQFKQVYSPVTFHRFTLDTTYLWNIGHYEAPYAIFGWRSSVGSFWIPSGSFMESVPPNLRFFLGGDADIRGFDRKEIPDGGRGFHTFVYNGFELRAGQILPWGIQPLGFMDIGWGGIEFMKLEKVTYASPGIGLRLDSKIGVFRGTASHGFIWGKRPPGQDIHWQFFLSYGQEF